MVTKVKQIYSLKLYVIKIVWLICPFVNLNWGHAVYFWKEKKEEYNYPKIYRVIFKIIKFKFIFYTIN